MGGPQDVSPEYEAGGAEGRAENTHTVPSQGTPPTTNVDPVESGLVGGVGPFGPRYQRSTLTTSSGCAVTASPGCTVLRSTVILEAHAVPPSCGSRRIERVDGTTTTADMAIATAPTERHLRMAQSTSAPRARRGPQEANAIVSTQTSW